MSYVEFIGFGAAILTTVSFFPQVYKIYKTKETKSISLGMYIAFTTGIALWLVYGFLLKSLPIILANLVTILSAFYILLMKIKHK